MSSAIPHARTYLTLVYRYQTLKFIYTCTHHLLQFNILLIEFFYLRSEMLLLFHYSFQIILSIKHSNKLQHSLFDSGSVNSKFLVTQTDDDGTC